MESGFVRGQSDNLPLIDVCMVGQFFSKNSQFMGVEVRGVKVARSSRESYGDDAVGYVQVKRDGEICTVKGRITPEHKVRATPYHCTLTCNENNEDVLSVLCDGCAASKGGCKHAVAFLMWLHRRSETPATTSVKCYWKKAALSNVGTSKKFIKAKDMCKTTLEPLQEKNGSFLQKVAQVINDDNIQIGQYIRENPGIRSISVHRLACTFKEIIKDLNPGSFLEYCKKTMSNEICEDVKKATIKQADSKLWFEMRYGRITASKAHEAAHCRTNNGSLVANIMGAAKFKQSEAMARGKALEDKVRSTVSDLKKITVRKSGLILNKSMPVMGASPDGVTEDLVVEIKCPQKVKNVQKYVNAQGKITEKCYTQIQLQMHFCHKLKGLFCVAAPDFELTKKVDIIDVKYDEQHCLDIIKRVEEFWKHCIYNKVMLE